VNKGRLPFGFFGGGGDLIGAPDGSIWAAAGGLTARWDGTRWVDKGRWVPPAGDVGIATLTVTPDGSIWAAGVLGFTARWDGTRWVNKGRWVHGDNRVFGLTTARDGSIWAAGFEGRTARWDGARWVNKGMLPFGCFVFSAYGALTAARDGSIWTAGGRAGNHTARFPWR